MNFLQRALASVTRRKGKSVILFLVIFILGNVIAGAIAIQQSTGNVERKMKADLGATATVEMDPNFDWSTNQEEFTNVSEETMQEIGSLSYVKEYDYSVRSYITTENFKTINYDFGDDGGSISYGTGQTQPSITLLGTNLKTPLSFSDKTVDLVDGRYFTDDELTNGSQVGIFSKKVAEENGFSVGDQVVLDSQLYDYTATSESGMSKGPDFPIEVIGIFEPQVVKIKEDDDQSGQTNFDAVQIETDQYNAVYFPNKAVQMVDDQYFQALSEKSPEMFGEMAGEDGIEFYATPTYQLKSPEDVEAFRQEAEVLLPTGYTIRASTDTYDEVGGSMKKLSQISGYVVIVAVIATLVIISLVVVLFLRDRKHELGIYLAIGEHRRNVVLQVLIELLIISVIAMGLSLVTGNLLGGSISDSLLQSDMLASGGNDMNNMVGYYDAFANSPTLTADDVQNAYEVTFSVGYIVTFIVTGLLTVFASALLPLVYILRLNPKKIMM